MAAGLLKVMRSVLAENVPFLSIQADEDDSNGLPFGSLFRSLFLA